MGAAAGRPKIELPSGRIRTEPAGVPREIGLDLGLKYLDDPAEDH